MCLSDDYFPSGFPLKLALLCFILNLFPIPGLGTVIYGHYGPPEQKLRKYAIGLAQFICTFLIFGWLWSAAYGFRILGRAIEERVEDA